MCSYGAKCQYLHPLCRYGSKCAKGAACIYLHLNDADSPLQPVTATTKEGWVGIN